MRKKNIKNWNHSFAHKNHNESVKDLFEWTNHLQMYRNALTKTIDEIRNKEYEDTTGLIKHYEEEIAIAKANIKQLSMECRVENMEIRQFSKSNNN